MSGSIVTLNVGGHMYTTSRSTLTRYPDSMLGAMLIGDLETLRDDQGRYFIDRDGTLFRHVLNFLRTSQLVLPEDFKELPLLEIEADFYQIQALIEALSSHKARLASCTSEDLSAHDVVIVTVENPNYSPDIRFTASSMEVQEMVEGLLNTLEFSYNRVAVLLKLIQDNGFHLHGFAASGGHDENAREHSWVLVRKNTKNSPDSEELDKS